MSDLDRLAHQSSDFDSGVPQPKKGHVCKEEEGTDPHQVASPSSADLSPPSSSASSSSRGGSAGASKGPRALNVPRKLAAPTSANAASAAGSRQLYVGAVAAARCLHVAPMGLPPPPVRRPSLCFFISPWNASLVDRCETSPSRLRRST